jgi:hypothetical protein
MQLAGLGGYAPLIGEARESQRLHEHPHGLRRAEGSMAAVRVHIPHYALSVGSCLSLRAVPIFPPSLHFLCLYQAVSGLEWVPTSD